MTDRLTVSVAMCTYQGERHLGEQLASIAAQTHRPDEVVVCDDRSTDGTVGIVERFRAQGSLSVRLHVNDTRLGWLRNFERVIGLCRSELIFFADQDDVWHPQKVEKLVGKFSASPRVGFAFSDAEVVDERLAPLGTTLWQQVRFGPPEQRSVAAGGAVAYLVTRPPAAGMTLAFRARFRDLILPFPEGWWHDAWVQAVLPAVSADAGIVAECLVKWRQHATQATGVRAFRNLERRQRMTWRVRNPEYETQVTRWGSFLERLHERSALYPPDPRALEDLAARLAHAEIRLDLGKSGGRISRVLRELRRGNYHRYSRGWWSAAKDLLLQ